MWKWATCVFQGLRLADRRSLSDIVGYRIWQNFQSSVRRWRNHYGCIQRRRGVVCMGRFRRQFRYVPEEIWWFISAPKMKKIVEAGRIDVVSCHSVASVTRAETKPPRKRAFGGTYPQEETRHWDVKWCESRNKTRPHIEMYWAFLEKQCKMCKKMVTTLIPICSWRSFRSLAQNRVVDGVLQL